MTNSKLMPQPGPQEAFLRSQADITVYGGAAGGGKSYALLLEPLYHTDNAKFRAVIFRRTIPQIKLQGGLWDTSAEVYSQLQATPLSNSLEWVFPSGSVIKFAGLESESARFDWQGSQIPLLMFDELCQFTANQFWYLLSRCRSMSGVRGYVRATCNPDPDSWVRQFISWWIDEASGLAIQSRSGVLRWFVRIADELHWADTPDELRERFGDDSEPKSVTFIPSSVRDNRILLDRDPHYMSNLKALSLVDRKRLLDGDWNVREAAGLFFRREWFEVVESVPGKASRCRFWDRAATPLSSGGDPDATAAVLLARDRSGVSYIEHVARMFESPYRVESAMLAFAKSDPPGTRIGFCQDPGSAGCAEAQACARSLAGYDVRFNVATGSKEVRAKGVSAAAESGNVKLLRGPWNDMLIRELENFPSGRHDDMVDALSGAFEQLISARALFIG